MLTGEELFHYIAGLVIVFFLGYMLIRRKRTDRNKNGFQGYVLSRLVSFKSLDQIPHFETRLDAVKYVARVINKVKYDYSATYGSVIIDDMQSLCEELVDEMCSFDLIPKSVYRSW